VRGVGESVSRTVPGWVAWLSSAEVAPTSRRFYAMMQASPLGMAMFVGGFLVFAWWRVWPLALACLAGVAVWIGMIRLAREGRVLASAGVAHATMCALAVLAVVCVGWDLGVQYVLVVQIVVCILNPWPRPVSVLLVATSAMLLVTLYLYSEQAAPLYTVTPLALNVAGTINTLATFSVVAIMVSLPVGAADRAEAALAAEHARSERLLTNVLPVPVAERLKAGEEPIADDVPAASVLFADIVDFTPYAARLPAGEVVRLLDGVFSTLDDLADEHGLEKVKTIGDAYMVAAGVPTPRPDHAHALAAFALAARDRFATQQGLWPALQLRIGIASGPVVAGVIGHRRFLYDLWGDTVNTASRMESHGLPGRIQIDDQTRRLLGDDFQVADRGMLDVKGKGLVHTWFLTDARRRSNQPG
jgi:class 3 adenylate cyclase